MTRAEGLAGQRRQAGGFAGGGFGFVFLDHALHGGHRPLKAFLAHDDGGLVPELFHLARARAAEGEDAGEAADRGDLFLRRIEMPRLGQGERAGAGKVHLTPGACGGPVLHLLAEFPQFLGLLADGLYGVCPCPARGGVRLFPRLDVYLPVAVQPGPAGERRLRYLKADAEAGEAFAAKGRRPRQGAQGVKLRPGAAVAGLFRWRLRPGRHVLCHEAEIATGPYQTNSQGPAAAIEGVETAYRVCS